MQALWFPADISFERQSPPTIAHEELDQDDARMTHLRYQGCGRHLDMIKEFGLLGVGSFWKACHELGLDTGKVACSLCLGTACFPTLTPDFRHEMWRGEIESKVWDSSDNGDQQMIKKEDLLADFKRRTSKLSRVQCGREIRHQPR